MVLCIMSPDVVLQGVANVVEETAASSTLRVANHWPDKHYSEVMITLFQILNYSPFMLCILHGQNTIVASLNVLVVVLVLHCILESTGSNIYPKAFHSVKFFFSCCFAQSHHANTSDSILEK